MANLPATALPPQHSVAMIRAKYALDVTTLPKIGDAQMLQKLSAPAQMPEQAPKN